MWRRLNFSNDSSSLFSDFFGGVGLDEKTNQTDDSTIKPVALEQSAVLYEVCFSGGCDRVARSRRLKPARPHYATLQA